MSTTTALPLPHQAIPFQNEPRLPDENARRLLLAEVAAQAALEAAECTARLLNMALRELRTVRENRLLVEGEGNRKEYLYDAGF